MTDPSGEKDRPAADPAGAYDPPPPADPPPYEPENYDPPSPDATIAAVTPDDTTAEAPAATEAAEAPAAEVPAADAPADATVAAEQPGGLPAGAYETPAAYIPGTPFAPPGQPVPPAYQQQPYPPAYGQPYAASAPYGQPAPYAQPYAAPRGQDNALAIGALVCSILGFCSGVTAIAGLVMGHIALSKTNRGEAGGRGLATAAVIVGYVVLALWAGFFTTLIILGTRGDLN
ncbi:DUF4190 domain-containing protein [Amycolatopsis kentuckyensis]|uniref:DUF4190 domain-containing protein n=1 Tax=Amycolatopsis kentuckyensis TaxID=218823 RepID=UPI000A3A5A61|nr:DUF4190 domain-containing protein [Amycolatopsis kentuckyensis]